ncbi:5,6-dimethylbenzimidazole synthase [Sphingomonas sp. TDK1]|uniref:5,6-dimethylbenzimidazole synthase n=1 Tax=Sphingomonas sp. TDK1 TaxID=453247 RepID=UPI0007D9B0F6|nr:5,6-dimethylbenzimidazole synthase [Sphingomonas sp. TDK1]OAN60008.1 5,6-dimethylbenzimidazole synthase [Sphingomonas sp. TDK1]
MNAPPAFDAAFLHGFDTLLRWRRDVRHFATRPIAEDAMRALLETAALAPSVGNAQPWRFVRLRSAAIRAALIEHVDAENMRAAEGYAGTDRQSAYRALKLHGLREAPELLAVFCDEHPEAGHGLGIATMPEMLRYSCVTAVHTMWLAARARGIGLGWVSILAPEPVTRLLGVPADWTLVALLCLGYPAEASETPELERHGWQAREPLADRLFER